MPPKVKVQKEQIIQTALEIVRRQGIDALNARTVASELGCSTQPVFSNFATMEALYAAVLAAAYDRYYHFLTTEVETGQYPPYKAFGMAYIRFAKEEKELFKLLFMRDRSGEKWEETKDWEISVSNIMAANHIAREKAERIHLEMWACVHGIAAMVGTSFLELDWELISQMLTDVYQGVRVRICAEEG